MKGRLGRKGRGGWRRGRGAARACLHSAGLYLPCVYFLEAVAEAPCCPFHAPFVFPSGFTPSTPLPPAVTLPAPTRCAADPAPRPASSCPLALSVGPAPEAPRAGFRGGPGFPRRSPGWGSWPHSGPGCARLSLFRGQRSGVSPKRTV